MSRIHLATLVVVAGCAAQGMTDDSGGASGQNVMTGTIWAYDIGTRTLSTIAVAIGKPRSLAMLTDGRLAATDFEHHVVEIIDPKSGQVTPLAGMWDAKGFADGQ